MFATIKSALTVTNHKLQGSYSRSNATLSFLWLLKHFLNPFRQIRSGVDCDVMVKNINSHLTVGKYWRSTNEITDYKIVALEYDVMLCYINAPRRFRCSKTKENVINRTFTSLLMNMEFHSWDRIFVTFSLMKILIILSQEWNKFHMNSSKSIEYSVNAEI
jgi:hypothetical protein